MGHARHDAIERQAVRLRTDIDLEARQAGNERREEEAEAEGRPKFHPAMISFRRPARQGSGYRLGGRNEGNELKKSDWWALAPSARLGS